MNRKNNVLALLTVLFLAVFSSPSFLFAAESPSDIAPGSCEVVLAVKNAGSLAAAFLDSKFVREFAGTKLFERYAQSSFFAKYSQLGGAFEDTFGRDFRYDKLKEFFDCDCNLFFIRTDWDRPLYLLEADRGLAGYEYFARFKKGLKSEKVGNTAVYRVSTSDGVDAAYFASPGARTYVSNSLDLIKSVAEGKTKISGRISPNAQVSAFFNASLLDVRMTPAFSGGGSYYAYFAAEKDGTLRMAAFTGNEPSAKDVGVAFKAALQAPADAPAFAAAAFGYDAAAFFAKASSEARRLSAPARVTSLLEKLAAKESKGAFLVADEAAGSKLGVYSAALACEKPAAGEMEGLTSFLPDMFVAHESGLLIVSTDAGAKNAGNSFAWAAGQGKSLGASPGGYFYMINFGRACDVASEVLASVLNYDSWRSSEAYDFVSDLSRSMDVLKIFGSLVVVSQGGEGAPNSVAVLRQAAR